MISVQVLEPELASRGTRMDRDAGLRLGTATREDRLDRDPGSSTIPDVDSKPLMRRLRGRGYCL